MNPSNHNTFLFLLCLCVILIFGDYITTYHGIINMGATELNPLYAICGSITIFFIVKAIASLIYIGMVIYYQGNYPKSMIASLIIINLLYGTVVISNVNQLMGA